ncbi:MAG TPA: rod shape-determining protein RodA [Verrucomicrobiae bacterium]|jgi:rod shape determining protein RodA|nr:rod shape-determining protein RodA [Verrucomicrobiae bacterium]
MFANPHPERDLKVDLLQLLAVLGLMVVSVAFVYSAKFAAESAANMAWYHELFFKQIIWFAVGLGAAVAICLTDYHTLARWSFVVYWISILTLIAVLIHKIGSTHGGARRWIDLPGFQFQPSEFAKLAFILAQAHFLSRPVEELRQPAIFWKALGLMVLPFMLIMKEPDLGSALVLVPTGLVMMFVAGTPKQFLLMLGAGAMLVGALLLVDVFFAPPGWWQIKLETYQRDRLLSYFGMNFARANASPEEKVQALHDQSEKSYQARQALISVGSGGFTGKGWRKADQIALGFLPRGAAHTDFIFSVIAEEEGFIGSVVVLTLYCVVLFTGIRTAGQARDRLGKLLAVGVVTLIFSHVFINIGMNIRIMPVTGVPLPLLSYGGSSVLGSLIAIGLLQNIHIYRKGY